MSAVYFDSSALVALVLGESSSETLAPWPRRGPGLSSAIARIEVLRAVRRRDRSMLPRAVDVLERLNILPVGDDVLALGARLVPPELRALDALHVASALLMRDVLAAFVTCDRRQAQAARDAGLPVFAPCV